MNSTPMAALRIGLTAMVVIILAKIIFVPLNIPGISKVIATV